MSTDLYGFYDFFIKKPSLSAKATFASVKIHQSSLILVFTSS